MCGFGGCNARVYDPRVATCRVSHLGHVHQVVGHGELVQGVAQDAVDPVCPELNFGATLATKKVLFRYFNSGGLDTC